MIKTEAQERKLNEDLHFQYLLGIKRNAEKEREKAWLNHVAYDPSDPDFTMSYIKYARADEKLDAIEMIIKAYVNQIRGGMTI